MSFENLKLRELIVYLNNFQKMDELQSKNLGQKSSTEFLIKESRFATTKYSSFCAAFGKSNYKKKKKAVT